MVAHDPVELVKLVEMYLGNESARRSAAQRLQQAVLARFTVESAASKILSWWSGVYATQQTAAGQRVPACQAP